jgi:hypothetical protein
MALVGYGRQASIGELVADVLGVAGDVLDVAAFGWSGSDLSAIRSISPRRNFFVSSTSSGSLTPVNSSLT